jgi:hypothetical protein
MDKLGLLESSLSWSEFWATMACGVVAIGLVIEYQSDFKKAVVTKNLKLLPIGALLVTIGVALEFVFQVRTSVLVSDVRGIQQKQASDSNERAANADKSAAEAKLALEEFKAHRKLKSPQSMVEKLKAFSGVPFEIGVQTEAEPLDLMGQVATVLKNAGWIWKDAEGTSLAFNVPGMPRMAPIILFGGVRVKISKSRVAEWGAASGALTEALQDNGIVVTAVASDDTPANAVHIEIGSK